MLPYFYSEILVKRKWFKEEDFIDILTVAQSVPGAIAVNASFNVGFQLKGFSGGVAAVLGMVIPAFTAVVLILLFFLNVRDHELVRKAITGIITASAALITISAIKLSGSVFRKGRLDNILIAIFVFLAIGLFNADIIWLLVFGVLVGVCRYFHKLKTIDGYKRDT